MKAGEARLVARFGASRRYWRARQLWRRVRFRMLSLVFRARYRASETSVGATALRYLFRETAKSALVVVALIVVLGLTNDAGRELADKLGLVSVEGSAYDVLLETVGATTGVFLALYFTAVSAIAATVYAAVPHDIRTLIIRDRLGNVYVRGVAFTMALAVLMLVVHAAAQTTYVLALPLIGVGALFSIFAFIRLGERAFYLADPTLLGHELNYQFFKWFDRVKHGQWRADEPAMQDHYRRQAKAAVDSLVSLLTIASGQPHLRGASAQKLSSRLCGLLVRYLRERHSVPTGSRWYGERYEHPQWYLSDYSRVQLASVTGALEPRTVPDAVWVEADLLRPLIKSVVADVRAGDYDSAYTGLGSLARVWEALGGAWTAEEGARWTGELADGVIAALTSTAKKQVDRPVMVPGIADGLAFVTLSLELGFHKSIVDENLRSLGYRLATSDWSAPDAAYAVALPRPVVQRLESIRDGLAFERASNAPLQTRTPGWWIRETAMHSLEWAFHEQIHALLDLVGPWCLKTADTLTEAELPEAAAAVLARAYELAFKLTGHILDWEEIADAIRGEPRLDYARPEWDWPALKARIREFRNGVDERLAKSIPVLGEAVEHDDELPDFLGHAVHRTGEACFGALADGDGERLTKLFGPYFLGILYVTNQVRPKLAQRLPQQAVPWMAEPVMDVLSISGYALIFAELHGKPELWQTVEAVLAKYFAPPDGAQRMQLIAAMHEHQRRTFGLTPRSLLRQGWRTALSNQIAQLPHKASRDWSDESEVDHPSALIRRIAPTGHLGMMQVDASDILVARYLSRLPAAQGLSFGVAEWIEREFGDTDDGTNAEHSNEHPRKGGDEGDSSSGSGAVEEDDERIVGDQDEGGTGGPQERA